MANYGAKQSVEGIEVQATIFTMKLPNTVTRADIGKALSQDITADDAAKLAGNGDVIIGKLMSVSTIGSGSLQETYGAVLTNGGFTLPVAAGSVGGIVRGYSVVGAGNGEVKASAAASTDGRCIITSTGKLATESVVTVMRV